MNGALYMTLRSLNTGRPKESVPMLDHKRLDGLEEAYEHGRRMGDYAEACAERHQITRDTQDTFATESLTAARQSGESGAFTREIAAVEGKNGRVNSDELSRTASIERILKQQPAFREWGTVTAAKSFAVSDGTAALVLASVQEAERLKTQPRAMICGQAKDAQQSRTIAAAPVSVIQRLLGGIGWASNLST